MFIIIMRRNNIAIVLFVIYVYRYAAFVLSLVSGCAILLRFHNGYRCGSCEVVNVMAFIQCPHVQRAGVMYECCIVQVVFAIR